MGLSSVRYTRNKGLAQGRRHAAGSGFYDNVALILRLSMVGAGHHLCRPCFLALLFLFRPSQAVAAYWK